VRVNSFSPSVAKLDLFIIKCYKVKIVQVYTPTTSHTEKDINCFYNDMDETLGKPTQYIDDNDRRLQCVKMEKNKPYGNTNK